MTGIKILIVEDENNVALYLADLVKDFGYSVVDIVASGEKAVERAEELRPDLVLMDILLVGDMDGVAAAEEIHRRLYIPVVYLTGYADDSTLQRAKLTSPFGYIVKPFVADQLKAAMQTALHKYRLESSYKKSSQDRVAALKSIADAVLLTDEKGFVEFMNPAAEALTGWSREEAGGKLWTEVFSIMRESPAELSDSSVVTGLRDQAILSLRNGSTVAVDYSASILRDESEKTTGFALIFRDVSERKQIEGILAESRHKYKELLNSIEGIVWEADPVTHQFSFVSKQARQLLGYRLERWINESGFWKDHLHPDDRKWVLNFCGNATKSQRDYEIEYRMMASDGRIVWVRDSFNFTSAKDKNEIKLRGVMIDVTDRKQMETSLREVQAELESRVQERTAELSEAVASLKEQVGERRKAEEALRESEERYKLAALGSNDGLWDWNLKANQIFFSLRWKTMLGHEENEIATSPEEWFKRVHPDDLERVKAEITGHLSGHTPHFENEHRMLHRDGSYRWMLTRGVAVRDELGAYRMAGSQSDITERKLAVEQLLHDAFHDALTNLSNRALFTDRLKGAAARAASRVRRGGAYLFAVLFLDLDRFKVVNDSLGHIIGDQLLIEIARRLESTLRPGDTIARLGGDEFAVLIEDINDASDAEHVAERLQSGLRLPFNIAGHEVFTSVSIGIALSSTGYERGEDLLRDADTAMYRAKSLGKARHQVFDKSMHGLAVALLQLETDMRRAIEREEFLIHYQPIVELRTEKITGFEALVRWQHPDRGLLPPEELIPVAEETGLILPIGRWVLQEACRQMKRWQEEFIAARDLTVTVNISGKQFAQTGLTEQIAGALSDTGLKPENLKLEITESVIMDNAEFATSMLLQLRALDVRLMIDDFGTGYSSLSYLHRFPINTLKIDRSFVGRIGTDIEGWEIVRTIVTLANNLGMDIVAEGVETAEQKEQLIALGCQHGQGYYFSRPVDALAAGKMINRQQPFA